MDRTHNELSPRLDELRHGFSQSGEIPLVHLVRVFEAVMGSNEPDMREGVDAEEREASLSLFELNIAEEDLGMGWRRRVLIVGDERGGDNGELLVKILEVELVLVMELHGVEEDEERVGSGGFDGGEEARDGVVVEVDHPRFGSRLQVKKL
ncbi:hypothetical protein PanWU01x14_365200 [Parasponia andersonii]|uniref:Uncharacterized protein n=1 Tax=Parasponia andersonii TaxID=3476 RepID=A0A2P5A640_PARAD|nr:hypothetical protein PanWU01x14_365200 [Parasponia andersonii]